MHKPIYAPPLTAGSSIGIFSPSCPGTAWIPERTRLAIEFLEKRGQPVICGELSGKEDHYRSGTILERAAELNKLIRDPNIRCIMASSGGFVSNSILPYIDYEALRRDPKIIVGYSDVTAVLLAIYAKTGLVTFYGPSLISTFGEALPYSAESYDFFSNVVSGERSFPYTYPMPQFWTEDSVGAEETEYECTAQENQWVCVRGGTAQGRLIGGNLDTLYGIWGSPYMPEICQGDILYLEEKRRTPEQIERAISHLEICGVFSRISGLVLGKCEDYNPRGTGMTFWEATMEILGKYSFPILAEFDCSHTRPMHTLPLGSSVKLDTEKKQFTVLERPVV